MTALRAEGLALLGEDGQVAAMAATPELAARIARAMASAGQIESSLEELLIACGLPYARDWAATEAIAAVISQVRMIRKAFPNERASI